MLTQSVFLFPGQGSQYLGMGKDLYQEFPEFIQTFEEASDALQFNMQKLCFEDPNLQLNLTEFTQPAILAVSTGIFRILQTQLKIIPDIVAGHSLGEYSALVALGALSFSDALRAVHFRGQAMQRAVPVGVGAMAAYLGSYGDQVIALCHEVSTPTFCVEVANNNCPTQLVLSGHREAVEKVCQLIAEKKLGRAKMLPVSAPFHSSLMKPAADEMSKFFENIQLHPFDGKIIANIDAHLHTKENYTKEMLVKQIDSPVLWTQTLHRLHHYEVEKEHTQTPTSIWIEVGPGKVLQGLTKKTFENQQCLVTNDNSSVQDVLRLYR